MARYIPSFESWGMLLPLYPILDATWFEYMEEHAIDDLPLEVPFCAFLKSSPVYNIHEIAHVIETDDENLLDPAFGMSIEGFGTQYIGQDSLFRELEVVYIQAFLDDIRGQCHTTNSREKVKLAAQIAKEIDTGWEEWQFSADDIVTYLMSQRWAKMSEWDMFDEFCRKAKIVTEALSDDPARVPVKELKDLERYRIDPQEAHRRSRTRTGESKFDPTKAAIEKYLAKTSGTFHRKVTAPFRNDAE